MVSSGPEPPLAAASVSLHVVRGLVQDARIVLGHVAPVPWIAAETSRLLLGRPVDEPMAHEAGLHAVAGATPLSMNRYKVQQAATAVERAILIAAGQPTGVI